MNTSLRRALSVLVAAALTIGQAALMVRDLRAATLNEIQVEPLPFGAPIGSTYINNYVLAANTNEVVTVPTGARWAWFSCDTNVWVRYDGTVAAVPAADITDGTGQELRPTIRFIRGVTTINMISATAGLCSVVFHKQTP